MTKTALDYDDVPSNFERQILMLVLWAGEDWYTVEQLGRHVGDLIVALDAMRVLSDVGLIHRQGDYVFPTRAAIHLHDLFGATW